MRNAIDKVSDDPRVVAALAALGHPVPGDYILTRPLVLTHPDGRTKGWRSPTGLPTGRVIRISNESIPTSRGIPTTCAYEICVNDAYGYAHYLRVICYPTTHAKRAVVGCPEYKNVPDVDWTVTLLTSLQPRPGALGLLSRIESGVGPDSSVWRDVFLRLIDEGAITEDQLRSALNRRLTTPSKDEET